SGLFEQVAQSNSKYKDDANYHFAMHFVEKNKIKLHKAFDIYLDLSRSKSHLQADVKNCLAGYYFNSYGVKKDYKKAFDIYFILSKRKSYYQNDAKFLSAEFYKFGWKAAKFELANCYAIGKGVTKDVDKACKLYLDLLT
ncbi:17256_t:CDS:2, partial [Gigaspora margarita]